MDWLDDQVRRGRIEEDAARCICWEDILQFAKSGIGRRLREADGKQRLWREQPFVLGIDARELYPEEEDGELILVQGIIDAYFMEEEEIVLVDYKTDRVGRTGRKVSGAAALLCKSVGTNDRKESKRKDYIFLYTKRGDLFK